MRNSIDINEQVDPMRTPLVLLLLSILCGAVAYGLGGPTLTLPLAVSVLAGVAAFLLVLKVGLFGARTRAVEIRAAPRPRAPKRAKPQRRAPSRHVVIDGSNVMHWNGEVARLATLREVIGELKGQGYQPGIIFDANAGYKLGDRYLDDRDFAKLLNLPGDRVLVVGKGEPADPLILAAARDLGAKVVTNDKYRDWAGDFPEVASSGHLVKGGYRSGALWLDVGALGQAA